MGAYSYGCHTGCMYAACMWPIQGACMGPVHDPYAYPVKFPAKVKQRGHMLQLIVDLFYKTCTSFNLVL